MINSIIFTPQCMNQKKESINNSFSLPVMFCDILRPPNRICLNLFYSTYSTEHSMRSDRHVMHLCSEDK